MTDNSVQFPILFLGHGSPMNALAHNIFTQMLNDMARGLPIPKSILCISAHWATKGTWVTHMENPKTIHDFYGFPKELFDVNYPAPGNPKLAKLICHEIVAPKINLDENNWGLDHGAWSVLKHL